MEKPQTLRVLRLICIALLVLGIVFRFTHLDRKVYWHDEVYTSMEMMAHSRSQVAQTLFTGREVTREELQAFQRFDPSHTLGQMWVTLGREDPQHPPLFYVLGWYWVQVFGDSVVAIRSLAVVCSLLVLLWGYQLCRELFDSRAIAWTTTALLALSPFQFVFAQEAREYGLWGALILLSSLLFLRALRQKTWQSWVLYSLSLALGLYTFLFTGLVAIAHGTYLLFNGGIEMGRRWGIRRVGISYLLAVLLALVALAPWLYFLIRYADVMAASTGWAKVPLPLDVMVKASAMNFSRILLDFDLNSDQGSTYLGVIPVLLLQGYALYFLCKQTPRRIWSFVLTLTFVPLLILALPDAIAGGQRSIVTRYLIPCTLGIEIAIAYLLTRQIQIVFTARRLIWQAIALLVVAAGIASCTVNMQADTWWNKVVSYHLPAIARTVNNSSRPIVISDAFGINIGNVISLSHLTQEKVRFFLLPEVGVKPMIPTIGDEYSDIFVLNLPENFRTELERSFQKKLVQEHPDFWKFSP